MQGDRDHYAAYYADKLWNLLPAVYRTEDTDAFARNGPLREMVNRIGAQAAVLRRSMDRMWEDQSIETCDDWLIPYIADLLATRLVASLDARGQRLDVARTIYYRRRKGTVALLEELAADITGWEARVVEFFRRLGRTRHGLDPEIGLPAETDDEIGNRRLQRAEGLVGALTHTSIGGWADLRNDYGATKSHSAFDEFFYTADARQGSGQVGWHNIPRIGVFLWRLRSFGLDWTTPVAVQNCPGHYTFDPTGREIALFSAAVRQAGPVYGEAWISPQEWQLPAPLGRPLLETALRQLRAVPPPDAMPLWAVTDPATGESLLNSLGVFRKPGNDYIAIEGKHVSVDPDDVAADPDGLVVDPERGRFQILQPPPDDQVFVTYHYGFSSRLGAGSYDRRVLGEPALPFPAPVQSIAGGGANLESALAPVIATGTFEAADSRTYTSAQSVGGIENLCLRAANRFRPVIRLPAPAPDVAEWAFTGTDGSTLRLEGLFVSGGDLVLRGVFDRVMLTCCTLDPGSSGQAENPPAAFAHAVDGRELLPCHVWVEAQVRELVADRCLLGPIRTRNGGEIEMLSLNDSLVQALNGEPGLEMIAGEAVLNRCSLLGPAALHRLYASECILEDVAAVEDTQHGCVRFSAWATGSILPGPYESVEIAPQAPLFTSRRFSEAGYGQLREGVDSAIRSGPAGATISQGAQDGAEMGAFAREKNPIKARSLLIKYEEFMPLGLAPILIYVT